MNEVVAPGDLRDSIDFVLFSAGAWRVGMEARWIRSSRGAPAHASGAMIEALLGMEHPIATAATTQRQYLQLRLPGGDIDILVGAPVELICLPASAIHAVPPLLAARTGLRALRALALAPKIFAQGAILLFDACSMLEIASGNGL